MTPPERGDARPHPVTPDVHPPREVLQIARKLEKAGFETWCVGGAVRDALLGHRHLDWDLATVAKPEEIRRIFARTVPVGIEFGTVGVLDNKGVMHEVTTYRRDVQTDGRHAVVEFGATLDEDLARRDYTINAIAFSPTQRSWHDPFDGRVDLEQGVVRAVGEPSERMREDRLRALRGMRFAARFDFEIEADTWRSIVASAPDLARLSAERVKQEIEKTMEQVRLPSRAFRMWRDSGALGVLIPALAEITDLHLAALDHLRIPGMVTRPQRKVMRLTGLFAGAKPREVAATLKSLRFSNAETRWISGVLDAWHQLSDEMGQALMADVAPADRALRRWAAIAGRTRLASVLRLADALWWAECAAGVPAPSRERVSSVYRRAIRIAYRDPIDVGDLAIGGSDLERIGITGPAVGRALRGLLERVINDPNVNTHDRLLAIASGEEFAAGGPSQQQRGPGG
ncbi:MAG TPA: CCA tRNA nucleotidyltransferase [Gemmatimonadaceae bacterium]|nr:CCA tRNA nucleotidyltransferase [Gemmatimonadaceae bacterium]